VSAPSAPELTAPPLDIRAWLAEAKPITKTVRVHGRVDVVAQINDLELRLAAAAQSKERAMSDKAPAALRRELDALRATYDASALEVTVRARTLGDIDTIQKAIKRDGANADDAEVFNLYATSHWMVAPVMDVETTREFANTIGVPQFEMIVAAWDELSSKVPVPTVPLSRRP
jgi:translation initiation factor IF-2